MARSMKFYGHWAEKDGRRVRIQGRAHTLRVRCYTQRYPYEEDVISVVADPCDKRAASYMATRAQLGDDWSIDVLESDPEITTEVWRQVEEDA